MTPSPPPEAEYSPRLTRDDRLRILTLRYDAGFTYEAITKQLGHVTYRQVQYTCQSHVPTPRKAIGQSSRLSEEEVDKIEDFIKSSRSTRRLSYAGVVEQMNLSVSKDVVARALFKRGYKRCKALRKPPLNEQNKRARLQWALEHVNWTSAQWNSILWSAETRVNTDFQTSVWVTRKPGEEMDETCLRISPPDRRGLMFWASFHGATKGPCLFWEKEWGSINPKSYRRHVVPLIEEYLKSLRQEDQHLSLMQDEKASGRQNQDTTQYLAERDMEPKYWPSSSPDLNPIEAVWNWMKDWIQKQSPGENQPGTDILRRQVQEAWDAVPEDLLRDLIKSMPERCQTVIDAEGGYTRF